MSDVPVSELVARLERLADDGSVRIVNFQPDMHCPPGSRGSRLWEVTWHIDAQAYNLCSEDPDGLPALLGAACEVDS